MEVAQMKELIPRPIKVPIITIMINIVSPDFNEKGKKKQVEKKKNG